MSILHGHNDVVRKVTWEPSGSFLVRLFHSHVTVSTCLPLIVICRLRVVQTGKLLFGISLNKNRGKSNS